jgi:TPP-dependent indolepyruvate ferredoxin oxidoreductase alpha subunit
MHADKECLSFFECVATSFKPRVLLKDVVHDQRKSTGCQQRKCCMEIRDANVMTFLPYSFVSDGGPMKHIRENV